MFCKPGCGRDDLHAQDGRHPAKLVEVRRVHLVMDGLGFEWNRKLRPCSTGRSVQRVEGEQVAALLMMRANPSHLLVALLGELHQPLAAKLVP